MVHNLCIGISTIVLRFLKVYLVSIKSKNHVNKRTSNSFTYEIFSCFWKLLHMSYVIAFFQRCYTVRLKSLVLRWSRVQNITLRNNASRFKSAGLQTQTLLSLLHFNAFLMHFLRKIYTKRTEIVIGF